MVNLTVNTFSAALATAHVLAASNNDVTLFENLNCTFFKTKIIVSFLENNQARPRLLVLADFILTAATMT